MRITTKHQNDRSDGGLQFILAAISPFSHRDDGLYSFYMLRLFYYSTIQLTNDTACCASRNQITLPVLVLLLQGFRDQNTIHLHTVKRHHDTSYAESARKPLLC